MTVASWLIAAVALVTGTIVSLRFVFASALDIVQGKPLDLVTPLSVGAAACLVVLVAGVWLGSLLERRRLVTKAPAQRGAELSAGSRAAKRRQQDRDARNQGSQRLYVRSRVYTRWLFFQIVLWFVITGHLIAAGASLWQAASWTSSSAGTRTELLAVAGCFAVIAGACFVPALLAKRKTNRLAARHQRVAEQIRSLAEQRDWTYSSGHGTDLIALATAPFSRVIGLTAWPSAHRSEGLRLDAAWLSGDFGPDLLPYRSFTSRAIWVHVPRQLQQVDFVPERFSDSVLKLLGGTDVDVESYHFNKRWRVKAADAREAHGILQPRMIEFLNSIDDQSVAFHVAGPSVVIWDDGKDEDVDLGARADLLEEFVARLPGHLRTPD